MSLAELIEFFCNQRKTGRLKIDYQRGHSVFFIREGELVDAKVGTLSGADAVYFSLTLPNAAFDFSPDVQATRRTIEDPWTQVVLEGLRRLDEGNSPTEADAFGGWSPSESELAQMLDQVDNLDAAKQQKTPAKKAAAAAGSPRAAASSPRPESQREESQREDSSAAPFSMMVESASGGGSKKRFMLAGVAAAVLLACAVAAVPMLKRSAKGEPAHATTSAPQPERPAPTAPAEGETTAAVSVATGETADATADASAAAADAARREAFDRERRDRERRDRARKEDDAAKNADAAADLASAAPAATAKPLAPPAAAPSGPKSVRVSVTYDEAGRVMQASVAGATPGAEAYGSTAVRIARGKHFPAGKPGSTVITIPVN
jgi:hypothetical protein